MTATHSTPQPQGQPQGHSQPRADGQNGGGSESNPAPASFLTEPPSGEVIAILDFGSQTAQLIARRVREAGAFSLLLSPSVTVEELRRLRPRGIILSGGPASVYEAGAPACDPGVLRLGVPVLGICYGMQLAARFLGGTIDRSERREFGRAQLDITRPGGLLGSIPQRTAVWMSHGDGVRGLDEARLETLASTPTCPHAVVRSTDPGVRFHGVQFHPEVTHTPHGVDILRNFIYEVCGCRGTWRMSDFAERACERVRERVGPRGRVLCGLSGGWTARWSRRCCTAPSATG